METRLARPGDDMGPERRASLADKGRRLYGKFCGTGGRGICAESFAVYHISRSEAVSAEDLAAHHDGEIELLEQSDPHDRLTATRGLVARVRQHLAAAETVPVLDEVVQRTGVALRLFVLGNALNPAGCSLDRADAV